MMKDQGKETGLTSPSSTPARLACLVSPGTQYGLALGLGAAELAGQPALLPVSGVVLRT